MKFKILENILNTTSNQDLFSQIFDNSKNILLLNFQLEQQKKLTIYAALEASSDFQIENSLLIPTSGTTSFAPKLVIVQKSAFLFSAHNINNFFSFSKQSSWLCTLPLFHVGGLSIVARAHFHNGKIHFQKKWDALSFVKNIDQYQISYSSIVPTQLYDLLKLNITPPSSLKILFVGGGGLDSILKKRALELNWPIISTYGMTETSSMISYSLHQSDDTRNFQLFPFVTAKIVNGAIALKTESLFSGYLIQNQSKFDYVRPSFTADNYWISEDLGNVNNSLISLIGREHSMIKIKGELVNLSHLNQELKQSISLLYPNLIDISCFEIIAFPNDRAENELCLLIEKIKFSLTDFELHKVIAHLNNSLLSYEKVKYFYTIDTFPRTDLGKIKFAELKTKSFIENYHENRKTILE